MLTVADALAAIMTHATAGPSEVVSLSVALGRVLAEPQLATMDSPPFDKALMDGFAVNAASIVGANDGESLTFNVAETITAGTIPAVAVNGLTCSRIMTGAPLPTGCDCVVPIELTRFDEQQPSTVTIPRAVLRSEANLIRQGTAARAGSLLLNAGTRLQPPQIAALAEFGIATVPVHRAARVAVLATGDELVPFDQPLTPGRIRNSNEPMLLAQVACCSAVPVALGVARDDPDDLFSSVTRGLQNDVLLLSGGVSAGMLDLVPQVLQRASVRAVFHGVNMKPGKPLWFGRFEAAGRVCLVFGLPGNPVSSLACFELFVRPALDRFHGLPRQEELHAVLTEPMTVKGNRPIYHPALLRFSDGRLHAAPVPWSGSSDLRATVDANGMILLLPDHGPYGVGEIVEAHWWGRV